MRRSRWKSMALAIAAAEERDSFTSSSRSSSPKLPSSSCATLNTP